MQFKQKNSLLAARFFDKKPVIGLSNFHTAGVTNKRVRSKGGGRDVSKPQMIDDYNAYMGGVDKMDQLCSYYEYPHKCPKWYLVVYHHLQEICIHNAYIIFKQQHPEWTLQYGVPSEHCRPSSRRLWTASGPACSTCLQ